MERRRLVRFDIAVAVLQRDAADLADGDATSFGRLKRLGEASEFLFAGPAAIEFLARREHGYDELVRKLVDKGFSPRVADQAAGDARASGHQSDKRFAASWIRSAMRGTGKSRAYIESELRRRKIDTGIVESAIEEYAAEHPGCFEETLRVLVERLVRRVASVPPDVEVELPIRRDVLTDAERKSVISRLMRRGFSTSEIQKHFR